MNRPPGISNEKRVQYFSFCGIMEEEYLGRIFKTFGGVHMHVLILGATGFLGRALIQELLSGGNQITVVTRNRDKAAQTLPGGLRILQWDYASPLASTQELEQVDAVVNLAGTSIGDRRWSPSVKQEIMTSRINATRLLVGALNDGTIKPKVLLNASAVGYYGPRGDEKITENDRAGNDFLAQVCKNWEKEAYRVQNPATRVVALRIGVVLDREGALKRMVMPYRFYLGGPLGSGNQWLSWIHREDLIKMMQFILDHDELKGPVNGTAPNPVTMREFANTLGEVLQKPSRFTVPEFLLKLGLGQMSEMLLHGQRAIPEKIINAGFRFRYPNLRQALEDILL